MKTILVPRLIDEKLLEIIGEIYSDDFSYYNYLINSFKSEINNYCLVNVDEKLNICSISNKYIFDKYDSAKNVAINKNLTNE